MRFWLTWAALAFLAMAASADTAIGVHLPLKDLSVWRMDGRTAWGFELAAQSSRVDNDNVSMRSSDGSFSELSDYDRRELFLSVALTRMRFRETDNDVRSFVFLRGETAAGSTSNNVLNRRSMSLSVGAGIGVGWQPFERVGVWVRKGIAATYRYNTHPAGDGTDSVFRTFSLGLRRSPKAVVYFSF